MSLITTCPACGTMFRVVPDQLKISEGWVRCGLCAEVFDATASLAEEASQSQSQLPPPPGPVAEPPPDDAVRTSASTATAGLGAPAPLTATPAPAPPPLPTPAPPLTTAPAPAFAEAPPTPPASVWPRPDSPAQGASDVDPPFVFRGSDRNEPDPGPGVLPPAGRGARDRLQQDEQEEQEAALEDISFVRQARRRALWRRPPVRALLLLATVGLLALLALQVAWQDRDRLALLRPELRPTLEQMCELLQCRLGPPRQIEALVIESSGFSRLRPDTYRLTFAVRNNAASTVAAPSMELTLTDHQDQAIVRRVLAPAELGSGDGLIAAGAEWSGAVGIVLAANSAPRVAGYRLLAFYP